VEVKQLVGKIYIGVACGELFPLELKKKSMEEGLLVVFPDDDHYKVEAPQEQGWDPVINTQTGFNFSRNFATGFFPVNPGGI